MTEPEFRIEKITIERAKELLALNTRNRALRRRHVEKLASDMKAGNWRLNGESIKVSQDDVLIDGQHRLAAVIEADTTVEMAVVYNLHIDDQLTIDTGARRQLRDILTLHGERNAAELASAIAARWRRMNGIYREHDSPTNPQALALLEAEPDLRISVSVTRQAARHLRISWGLCAALHYEQALLDAEDSSDFWNKLALGAGLGDRHPVFVLRKRLEENAATTGRKLDRVSIHAYLIKAWNAYREGREITLLRFTRGGANPEEFPELI
jgi:hypothetical protein